MPSRVTEGIFRAFIQSAERAHGMLFPSENCKENQTSAPAIRQQFRPADLAV
jgi:hypothetical protein